MGIAPTCQIKDLYFVISIIRLIQLSPPISMGNVCAKEQTDPEAFQNKPQLHSSILCTLCIDQANSEMDKVQEIKEFLTLTSENTDSFFVTEHYCPTDSS